MSDEWGPWVEHGGKGCPVEGQIVQSEERNGLIEVHVANGYSPSGLPVSGLPSRWVWSEVPPSRQIIRYRIRKPRALLDLIERARELDDAPEGPVRVPAKEGEKV